MEERLYTPAQELIDGYIWPLLPLTLAAGIIIGDHWVNLAMRIWPVGLIGVCVSLLSMFLAFRLRQLVLLFASFLIGIGSIGWEYASNDTIIMPHRYFGPIEGRIVEIDQSHGGKLRLVLEDVRLDGRKLEGKARISLHGAYHVEKLRAGAVLQTTGHLGPPNGPAEPGGYDFRKRAWMDGIAAVGYTRNPTIFTEERQQGFREWLLDKRRAQTLALTAALGERTGGFAAAILVGEKSKLDQEVQERMRASNLAHLLAISGMHMGTICGLVFITTRRTLSIWPKLANTRRATKIAILVALGVTFGYWLFSGMAYSASRAFIMAVLFFSAMLFRRRAFSLRNVSYAALLLLLISPTALFDIGFQMSFAATAALIVSFNAVPYYHFPKNSLLRFFAMLLFTSFIAGLATAPIAAYHFNQIPKYGLLANFAAVPLMSFVVLPGCLLWVLTNWLGIGDVFLFAAGLGIDWIIVIGQWVSALPYAVTPISAGHWSGISVLLLGSLLYIIFRGRAFYVFMVFAGMSALIWHQGERPYLLIAETGRFFGVRAQEEVRMFSRDTGHSFQAEIWAKGDGDEFDQFSNSLQIDNDFAQIALKDDWELIFTTTKSGARRVHNYCNKRTLIVAAQAPVPNGGCIFLNEENLFNLGGAAIEIKNDEIQITPFAPNENQPWSLNYKSG